MAKKQSTNSKLEIIYLPVSSLVKLPGNPRKDVDPEAINKLAALIGKHGFQNPLQVFREASGIHTILCGNHRFDAGLTLGMTEFPCLIYTGDKKAALARAISDNKSSDWTDWSFPELKDMITELDEAGDFDLWMTGFTQDELNEAFGVVGKDAEPQIDKAEELNKVWKVKTGDLWQIGEHRLLCGDSTKAEDVERVMGGDKSDALITDIPYNVNLNQKNLRFKKIGRGKDWGDMENDIMSSDNYFVFLSKAFSLCSENMNKNSSFYIWYGGLWHGVVSDTLDKAGLKIWRIIIWVKPRFVFSILPYQWRHESCVMGWKKGGKPDFYHIPVNETTVWEETYEGKKMATGEHPTQKPLNLIARCIHGGTNKNEMLVLDPFLGSGTTMVACQNLNRKCRGIEISPAYCAVILERMATAFPGIEIKKIDK